MITPKKASVVVLAISFLFLMASARLSSAADDVEALKADGRITELEE